jgi:hypothetical protein
VTDRCKLLGWVVAGSVIIYVAWIGTELVTSWSIRPWSNLLATVSAALLSAGCAVLFLIRGFAVLRRGQWSSASFGFLIALVFVAVPTAGIWIAPQYESEP